MTKSRLLQNLLLVGFIGAVGSAVWLSIGSRPTARQIRTELWQELRPIVLSNCTMKRFGGTNDGGYLMCENLLGHAQAAYSYGIGPQDAWGCHVSETLNISLHQYDCFSPPEGPCPNGRSTFHNECIGPRKETIEARPFDTLTNHLRRNGDRGKTLVMKIDIEGAEVASIMATPQHVLDRIDQLAMEIHGTNREVLRMVRKLKRTFHLIHLHFNNQACAPLRHSPLPSGAYQVLFVNKRIGVIDPTKPFATLPHPLDAPDYALGGDCQTVHEY
jgi:hypothetical protein